MCGSDLRLNCSFHCRDMPSLDPDEDELAKAVRSIEGLSQFSQSILDDPDSQVFEQSQPESVSTAVSLGLEEAAKRLAEEEALKKQKLEEEAKKKQEEEAAQKKHEEEKEAAEKEAAEKEAAQKKHEEEEAAKRREEGSDGKG